MALVMLPCELPWWSVIQRKLGVIQNGATLNAVLETMLKVHELCNVSLDPDEDVRDESIMDGLRQFLEKDFAEEERHHFLSVTIRNIAKHARNLKAHRPPRGLAFSLQQQSDSVELPYGLVASLIANAFFSTFPKRTEKTHPTLQDFNFTHFFKELHSNTQKAKFRCLLQYFDWLETDGALDGNLRISRKVMTGKQWLTIEDWLECTLPLCPIEIRHDGRIERSNPNIMQTLFVSSRIGGEVLNGGRSQECALMSMFPELLTMLIYVEALEDNEVVIVEHARQIGRIVDPKNKAYTERIETPQKTAFCCMDAEDYSALPHDQFEEDNILRELNKCLLAFRQNTTCPPVEPRMEKKLTAEPKTRLSPIGETSTVTTPSADISATIIIKQPSTSPRQSSCDSNKMEQDINKRRSWLSIPDPASQSANPNQTTTLLASSNRRGRFIVLGSSGECLPVNRKPLSQDSMYSSCESSNEEFHSAHESPDDSDDEYYSHRYSRELNSAERRLSFAQKLRDALEAENLPEESNEGDNYAVGISISGSRNNEEERKLKVHRGGGSRGFMLEESAGDDEFYKESLDLEREWVDRFRSKHNGPTRREAGDSSKYSFSTEFSSELEEVYEQFAKWLDDPIETDKARELDPRDEAVLRFASSLLKRTLSESFVGVPLTDGCVQSSGAPAEETSIQSYQQKRNKMIIYARSLSLELAKHKHRLAAQLISHIAQKRLGNSNLAPVATGNWGCGNSKKGDAQLKLVIQWMASSVAGNPMIYYTFGHDQLTKLDTVCRILLDRKWTVGELANATLHHAREVLEEHADGLTKSATLFDKLIGIEPSSL